MSLVDKYVKGSLFLNDLKHIFYISVLIICADTNSFCDQRFKALISIPFAPLLLTFLIWLHQRRRSRCWLTWPTLRTTQITWSIWRSFKWPISSWTCSLRRMRTSWSLEWVSITPTNPLLSLFPNKKNILVHHLSRVMFSGGLCNLSMDPQCRDIILQSSGISLVTNCLSSQREETVLSAITTLMNLTKPSSRSEITDPAILQCMLRFSLSESPRLRNLAAVFLQDCCTQEQVTRAEQQMQGQQTAVGIPLPKD